MWHKTSGAEIGAAGDGRGYRLAFSRTCLRHGSPFPHREFSEHQAPATLSSSFGLRACCASVNVSGSFGPGAILMVLRPPKFSSPVGASSLCPSRPSPPSSLLLPPTRGMDRPGSWRATRRTTWSRYSKEELPPRWRIQHEFRDRRKSVGEQMDEVLCCLQRVIESRGSDPHRCTRTPSHMSKSVDPSPK